MPAGDRSRLEEAMALVPDSYFYDQIVYQINRCETAWVQSQFYTDLGLPKGFSRLEEIAGDVQRTIRTTDPLKADADAYDADAGAKVNAEEAPQVVHAHVVGSEVSPFLEVAP